MKSISLETLDKYGNEFAQLNDAQMEALVAQFEAEQEPLLVYLMEVYGEDLDDEERQFLFFMGLQLWYTVRQTQPKMNKISEELIDEIDEDNDQVLMQISEAEGDDFVRFADDMLKTHPQRDMIEFVLAVLFGEAEDDEEEFFDEETKSALFVSLKVVVEALHESVQ